MWGGEMSRKNRVCERCQSPIAIRTPYRRNIMSWGWCPKCFPDEIRCQIMTTKGTPCRGVPEYPFNTCKIHRDQDTLEPPKKKLNYYEYIQSKEWIKKANAAKKRADGRCQLCYKDGSLHAHHRTYKRLGDEKPNDITVLCANCHAKFHDIVPAMEQEGES